MNSLNQHSMASKRININNDNIYEWLCSTGFLLPRNEVELTRFERLFPDKEINVNEGTIDPMAIIKGDRNRKSLNQNGDNKDISDGMESLRMAARKHQGLPDHILDKIKKNHIALFILFVVTIIFYSAFHLYSATSVKQMLVNATHQNEMLKLYHGFEKNTYHRELLKKTFTHLPLQFASHVYYVNQNNEVVDLDCYRKFTKEDSARQFIQQSGAILREELKPDVTFVDRKFLEENHQVALQAWQSSPWSAVYDTAIFEQLIYPYRVFNELLTPGWRNYLHKKYTALLDTTIDKNVNNPITICDTVNSYLKSNFKFSDVSMAYPVSQDVHALEKTRQGSCDDLVVYTSLVMRSLGLPVGRDFTPHWAHTYGRHSWNYILDANGQSRYFQGAEFNTYEHQLGSEYKDHFRIAKVYRNVFFDAQQSLNPEEYPGLPLLFYQKNIADVSENYGNTIDIKVELPRHLEHQVIFLCVYNDTWRPVAYARKEDDAFTFAKVIKDILYLSMYLQDNQWKAATDPFYLKANGEKIVLRPGKKITYQASYYNRFERGDQVAPQDEEVYLVSYWDNGWQGNYTTGATQTAEGNKITMQVPEGALYRIHNTGLATRRSRPFYIKEDNEQYYF